MESQDTVKLLKECDAGTKMAVNSINDVICEVSDEKLKALLEESRKHHEKLGNELHELLLQQGEKDQEPSAMAKGMSWMKTNIKMSMDHSDSTVAELMTEGCDMGIQSINKYINQYESADVSAKALCKRLESIEKELRERLESYLR